MSQHPPYEPPFGDELSPPEPAGAAARGRDAAPSRSLLEAEELDAQYYLRVMYRRRWSVATVFIVALMVALVRNYTAVPEYQARVRVLVEPERLNLVDIQDPVNSQRSLDAELAILQSRWLAKRTVMALGLVQPGEAAAPAPSPARTRPAPPRAWASRVSGALASVGLDVPAAVIDAREVVVRTAVKSALGLDTPGPVRGPASADETPAEAQQIDAFLGGLNVSLTGTGLLDVTYRSVNPVLTATYANAHAQEYIEQNLELRLSAVKEVADWLSGQVSQQREKVDASDQALVEFRETYGLVAVPGAQHPSVARVNELSAALTAARTDRIEKQTIYNRVLALRGDTAAMDRLPQVGGDAAIQRLRTELDQLQRTRAQLSETLLERHPEMVKAQAAIQSAQARLETERSRIVEALRQSAAASERAEVILANELAAREDEVSAQNERGLELNILMREAESNRQIYDMLVQRTRDTSIAQDINPKRMRILDGALVPAAPVAPNKRRNLMFAIAVGFMLSLGLALGFEYFDSRIKSPEQVQARLGLPFLGLVPELRGKGLPKGAQPLISNGLAATFTEAIRRLRTNVLFTLPDDPLKSVVVTSTGPEEGKTVVACNLALGLAYGGKRVLLIDADMRRPAVHTLFGVRQEPGLSNLLVGGAKAKEAMLRTDVPNLWVLSAGRRPPNPSELLGSQQFKTLLESLRGHFDWVLIDAPPVMAVTDACVIGNTVSGVVFVVGAEMTSTAAARRAIEQLEAVGSRLLGVVLSRADIDRHGYYYAPYYDRKYGQYYERVAT
jgi:succinoglycan biosynthesis transport protein ExoP